MEKYLFTDGTNGVSEVYSQEELKNLIDAAPQPEKIRIWIFSGNEWISYAGFSKLRPSFFAKENPPPLIELAQLNGKPPNGKRWLKKFLFFIIAGGAIFLVYNFTKIKWEKAAPLNIIAERPSNVPLLDIDSLIAFLEETKGQPLDRITRTNLRIRNTWPERIILQLNADRDNSSAGSRFSNIELSIDNTTGYNIDKAIVKLSTWKNGGEYNSDTLHFNNISYATAAKRNVKSSYRGDSLSISFQTIKAKSFNFCYSADKKSNYGNDNDKWFCRE